MPIFKEYGDAERKFAHDEYIRFKATARRNRLLGQWAAAQLGKQGSAADAYANEVVEADFEEISDRDIIAKLKNDFLASGRSISEDELRRVGEDLMQQAMRDIRSGGPITAQAQPG
jgi:hypothetical protein